MTDMPTRSSLVSPASTEGVFQDALGAFYDVVSQMAEQGAGDPQTIASGSITPLRALVLVETEGSAPTDDLTTIDASVISNKLVFIGLQEDGRELTIKHNTTGADHIRLKDGIDYLIRDTRSYLVLRRNVVDGHWEEIMRTSSDLSIPDVQATGTGDTIVADFPAPLLMSDGRMIVVRAAGPNVTFTPNIAVDGASPKTIVKKGNAALSLGDISDLGYPMMLQWNASLDKYILLNPAKRTELDMYLSDNTTANVSTSRHGLMPKLSNDPTQYMNGLGLWDTIPSAQVFSFTSSGTFTKPTTGSIIIVELWAGGGSGGVRNSGGGGGGGAYARRIYRWSDIGSTLSVTVGAGGLARPAGVAADGDTGGDTSVNTPGSTFRVYGGGGGSTYVGGGGGGLLGAGTAAGAGGNPKGGAVSTGGAVPGGESLYGGAGGGTTSSGGTAVGGDSAYGGGGGGGAQGPSSRASRGGNSIYGGGGGGGSNLTLAYSDNSGGVSTFAGNGGKGANWVNWPTNPPVYDPPVAGGFPSGGGGGTATSYTGIDSAPGGDGFARIIVI